MAFSSLLLMLLPAALILLLLVSNTSCGVHAFVRSFPNNRVMSVTRRSGTTSRQDGVVFVLALASKEGNEEGIANNNKNRDSNAKQQKATAPKKGMGRRETLFSLLGGAVSMAASDVVLSGAANLLGGGAANRQCYFYYLRSAMEHSLSACRGIHGETRGRLGVPRVAGLDGSVSGRPVQPRAACLCGGATGLVEEPASDGGCGYCRWQCDFGRNWRDCE